MMTKNELAERCSDAYSTDNYQNGWGGCVLMLRRRGYDDREVESILRSKWTRWAADMSDKPYGRNTGADLARFMDTMDPETRRRRVAELVVGTFPE